MWLLISSKKYEILKEIPVILFFFYLSFLCVLFHNREHMMLDYTLTYDHFWYFYHRLQEGALAQWNPYSLLGRIAVQWNYISFSMFSPIILFLDISLKNFHHFQIISTFISISIIYGIGRIYGYGRFFPLLTLILLMGGGYKYWASFLKFSTFLFFYPLAILCLLSALSKKGHSFTVKWLMFVVILALSFFGFRLEKITYALCFILIIFFVLGAYQFGNWRRMSAFFVLGVITVAVTLALNAWQLSLLFSSTIDNYRLSGGGLNLYKLFDLALWKWAFFSILYQPAFILICFNLILLSIYRFRPEVFSKNISIKSAFILAGAELVLIKLIILVQSFLADQSFISSVLRSSGVYYKNVDIIFSWYGLLSITLSIFFYSLMEKRITVGKILLFFAVLFAGFYIAEYSWHTWPINRNRHFFFMPPEFASFVPFGTIALMMKRRTWIVATLVVFHLLGETGSFFLFEIAGIPWAVPRAALMEIPFQVVVMLEGVIFLVKGISLAIRKKTLLISEVLLTIRRPFFRLSVIFPWAKKLFSKVNGISFTIIKASNKIDFANVETKVASAAKLACLIFAFLTIKMFLMPMDAKGQVYVEDFPFGETRVDELGKNINKWIYEAYENSERIRRKYAGKQDPFKRVPIDDYILKFGVEMYYKFMPAYSRTLNTAPVYATEIPKTMKQAFSSTPGKEEVSFLRYHPEMNPLFFAYKRYTWDDSKGDVSKLYDYIDQTTIFPHKDKNPVVREIMAEEGSNTPRAFLTRRIVKFNNYVEEYNYLDKIISGRGLLTGQITTSDENFSLEADGDGEKIPLRYDLEFKKDAPEHIVLRSAAGEDTYLALMDTWSKGWRAYIDGRETEIYRGYIGTRFIRVESGEHIVEFKYTVPGLIMSSIVSVVAWIMMLLAMIIMVKITKNYNRSVSV